MLALKTVLQSHDPVSVLIFDEVDAGISGRIAEMVGRKLRSLGMQQQTLCVTHLPQIASIGNTHYKVLKTHRHNFSCTDIIELKQNDRLKEIARMLSGDKVTEEAIANAKKMLDI